jgi:hypothetical protein
MPTLGTSALGAIGCPTQILQLTANRFATKATARQDSITSDNLPLSEPISFSRLVQSTAMLPKYDVRRVLVRT